jgi:hypothetical protein
VYFGHDNISRIIFVIIRGGHGSGLGVFFHPTRLSRV